MFPLLSFLLFLLPSVVVSTWFSDSQLNGNSKLSAPNVIQPLNQFSLQTTDGQVLHSPQHTEASLNSLASIDSLSFSHSSESIKQPFPDELHFSFTAFNVALNFDLELMRYVEEGAEEFVSSEPIPVMDSTGRIIDRVPRTLVTYTSATSSSQQTQPLFLTLTFRGDGSFEALMMQNFNVEKKVKMLPGMLMIDSLNHMKSLITQTQFDSLNQQGKAAMVYYVSGGSKDAWVEALCSMQQEVESSQADVASTDSASKFNPSLTFGDYTYTPLSKRWHASHLKAPQLERFSNCMDGQDQGYFLNIQVVADGTYTQKVGGANAVAAAVEQQFAAVREIYKYQFNIHLQISVDRIYTSHYDAPVVNSFVSDHPSERQLIFNLAPLPEYLSNADRNRAMNEKLLHFANWRRLFGDPTLKKKHVSILMSAAMQEFSLANLGTICQADSVAILNYHPHPIERFIATAHELAHLLNAPHPFDDPELKRESHKGPDCYGSLMDYGNSRWPIVKGYYQFSVQLQWAPMCSFLKQPSSLQCLIKREHVKADSIWRRNPLYNIYSLKENVCAIKFTEEMMDWDPLKKFQPHAKPESSGLAIYSIDELKTHQHSTIYNRPTRPQRTHSTLSQHTRTQHGKPMKHTRPNQHTHPTSSRHTRG